MYLILNSLRARHLFRSYVIYIYIFISILSFYYIYSCYSQNDINQYDEIIYWGPRKEESCHFLKKNDALPLLLDNATFPSNSVFFHETTCRGGLTYRQACVVESAALAHPHHQIYVLFTSPVLEDAFQDSGLKTLSSKYKNVKFLRVHIKEFVKGTPLSYTVNQLSDDQLNMYIAKVMTYLTMYKYSGVYLGLDVIVARSLAELWKNWVVRETPETLSTDMFSFSENQAGRKLAEVAIGFLLSEMSINKERDMWSYSGPSVLSHAMQLWCTTNKIQGMSLSTCDDFAVYGPELFYPISFYNRQVYFSPAEWETWKEEKIYTYHVWEYFTKFNLVTEFSLYSKLAAEYCPNIYTTHREQIVTYP